MRITKSKIVCIFLILAGCSPTKRLSNLLNKNPYLVTSFDTTIFFETKSIDTSFIFTKNSDTFFIKDTKTKIFRHYDTLRVFQDPIRDSVIIKIKEIKIIPTEKKDNKLFLKILILLSLIAVIFVSYTFRNIL